MRKYALGFMLVASVAWLGSSWGACAALKPQNAGKAKVFFPHPEINFYAVTPNPDLSFTVMRSGPLNRACVVRFRCLDGTAQQGIHFAAPLNDTVVFAPGEAFATSDPFVFMNAAIGKQFQIELRSSTRSSIGQNRTVVATIREDV